MKWAIFSGDHYQVGYQLGRWWGTEIKRLQRSRAGREFLQSKDGFYEEQLQCSWSEQYLPLLRNVLRHFPNLVEEINGMAKGAQDAGFTTSFLDMFVLTLGETVVPKQRCTSFVAKTKHGYLLAHNEEENACYPLCFAKVHLKTSTKDIQFISASYPFDLLCSSAGLNQYFAFQGNSVGCNGKYEKLCDTWGKRIPKTVFSRTMVEFSTLEEIVNLYAEHHSTLPNHQYVCFAQEAYSIEIRPLIHKVDIWRQFVVHRIDGDLDLKTNHHTCRDGGIDVAWLWRDRSKESQERMKRLMLAVDGRNLENVDDVMDVLISLRMNGPKYTLASIVLELVKGKSIVSAKSYFGGIARDLDSTTIQPL